MEVPLLPPKSHLTAEARSGTSFEWGAVPACFEQGEHPAPASFCVEKGEVQHHPAAARRWVQDWSLSPLTNGGEALEPSSPIR